jgi:hypothetical protein
MSEVLVGLGFILGACAIWGFGAWLTVVLEFVDKTQGVWLWAASWIVTILAIAYAIGKAVLSS